MLTIGLGGCRGFCGRQILRSFTEVQLLRSFAPSLPRSWIGTSLLDAFYHFVIEQRLRVFCQLRQRNSVLSRGFER